MVTLTVRGQGVTSIDHLRALYLPMAPVLEVEGVVIAVSSLYLCRTHADGGQIRSFPSITLVHLDATKLESPMCSSARSQAHSAFQQGAAAVIFDISSAPEMASELFTGQRQPQLPRPVLVMADPDVQRLADAMRPEVNISARVTRNRRHGQPSAPAPAFTYFDIALFVVFFLLICLLSGVVLYKIRNRRQRDPALRVAKSVLHQIPTRRYGGGDGVGGGCQAARLGRSGCCSGSSPEPSDGHKPRLEEPEGCTICLDEYRPGQELRVLPCRH
ncbi:E3 ubiquitin-protein ligase ZNRF3-like [Pollicipes pollicipes]|uniref:E3 ubiquitin-protein ligase ZNRF3-like n=1 Tax=Pollicipes pollicipes TaxID=41117 RepID=UPI0018858CCB|nr:E3 ubiquitin-protein ligase ZNRF3-like [Pollicipes pollicipes]